MRVERTLKMRLSKDSRKEENQVSRRVMQQDYDKEKRKESKKVNREARMKSESFKLKFRNLNPK